jgi:hypothetical protein
MEFEVTDGLGAISTRSVGIGEYLRIDKPVSIVWDDCRGSVAQYMCLLPGDDKYRKQVREMIMGSLYNDYTDNEQALYDILAPLFKLFDNGRYFLKFYNNKQGEFFSYNGTFDPTEAANYNWAIKFAQESLKIEEKDKLDERFNEFIKTGDVRYRQYYKNQTFQFHTSWFYPVDEFYFIATRPYSEIDEERVKFYEQEIKAGKRPFVIAFEGYCSYFILDGHHKLKAYHNLNLDYPPVVAINDLNDLKYDADDIEFFATKMLPGQIQHILENWDDKDMVLAEKLNNPDSPLHNFIRNGLYKEHYDNGQLKHEAFYVNDKIDGEVKGWYESGELMLEEHYSKGIRCGNWKYFHENGLVYRIIQYNDKGQLDGYDTSFYSNGEKEREVIYKNNSVVPVNESVNVKAPARRAVNQDDNYIKELGERIRQENNKELRGAIITAILFLLLLLIRLL